MNQSVPGFVALIHLCCLFAAIRQKMYRWREQFTRPSQHSIHLSRNLSVDLLVSVEGVESMAATAHRLMCLFTTVSVPAGKSMFEQRGLIRDVLPSW